MSFQYISELVSRELITHELAMESTAAAYVAAAGAESVTFPVLICHTHDSAARFSVKPAASTGLVGLKIGSYWPQNSAIGLARHSSSIILIDNSSGRVEALIEASTANAYRTAAGDAIAVKHLARQDAEHLAIFGAGHQALFECEAVMRMRAIRTISIVNRDNDHSLQLASRLEGRAEVFISSAEEACRRADIIVTVTAARAPLFESTWVKPGTHISCMGADARGKQELPIDILLGSRLYCDLIPQSITVGEYQHIAESVHSGASIPVNIGDVISRPGKGRTDPNAITVFDSSGLALQDLYLARSLIRAAHAMGLLATK